MLYLIINHHSQQPRWCLWYLVFPDHKTKTQIYSVPYQLFVLHLVNPLNNYSVQYHVVVAVGGGPCSPVLYAVGNLFCLCIMYIFLASMLDESTVFGQHSNNVSLSYLSVQSYLQSLRERQMGTGSSTSSVSTITHTLIDFDFETGSMVPLTASSPVFTVWRNMTTQTVNANCTYLRINSFKPFTSAETVATIAVNLSLLVLLNDHQLAHMVCMEIIILMMTQ